MKKFLKKHENAHSLSTLEKSSLGAIKLKHCTESLKKNDLHLFQGDVFRKNNVHRFSENFEKKKRRKWHFFKTAEKRSNDENLSPMITFNSYRLL